MNLGTGPDGGWYLNIPATDWSPNPPEAIRIGTDSLLLEQGVNYKFKRSKGSAFAYYDKGDSYAALEDSSSLYITKFDPQSRILSGTFFFTGTKISTGEKVSITEGRFDIRY